MALHTKTKGRAEGHFFCKATIDTKAKIAVMASPTAVGIAKEGGKFGARFCTRRPTPRSLNNCGNNQIDSSCLVSNRGTKGLTKNLAIVVHTIRNQTN